MKSTREWSFTLLICAAVSLGLYQMALRIIGEDKNLFSFSWSTFQSNPPSRLDNELWAEGALQSLGAALEVHHRQKGIYPMKWSELYPRGSEAIAPPQFRTRRDALENHPFAGYRFTYTPEAHRFKLIALPSALGKTGSRSFFLDQSGGIRHCLAAAPDQAAGPLDRLIGQPPVACLGISDDNPASR